MDIESIANSSYMDVVSGLRRLKFIESVTLIGKLIGKRENTKVMDIDLVIITRHPMKYGMYNQIDNLFSSVCKKYTDNRIDVIYVIADGPMKPTPSKTRSILLHGILHTRESYVKMPLQLCKNSWQQFRPVKGKPLRSYQSFEGVSKRMLLDSALGINHLIKLVSKDQSGYIGWTPGRNHIMKWRMRPLKFKHRDEKADFYIYSVLRAASNTMRYMTGDNRIGIGEKMAEIFSLRLPGMKLSGLPSELIKEKKRLRNKKYCKNENLLKKQAMEFPAELKRCIESD